MWGEKHATLAAQQIPQNVTETNLSRESEMLECVINQNLLWEHWGEGGDLASKHNVASIPKAWKVETRPMYYKVHSAEMLLSSNDSCLKNNQKKPSIYLLTPSCLVFRTQKSIPKVWLSSNFSFTTWHRATQDVFSIWKKPEGPIQTRALQYIKFKKSQGLCRKH